MEATKSSFANVMNLGVDCQPAIVMVTDANFFEDSEPILTKENKGLSETNQVSQWVLDTAFK